MPHVEPCAAEFGWPTLVDCAKRGDITMPEQLVTLYDEVNEAGAQRPRNETVIGGHYWDLMHAYNQVGGGEALIRDHIQPALAEYMEQFTAAVAKLGKYVDDLNVPIGVVLEDQDTRETYVRWTESHPHYYSIRACWKILARGGDDPRGVDSPFAEIRDIGTLIPNWEAATGGGGRWPWSSQAHWIRLAWIVRNGGTMWAPTVREWNAEWARYRSGTRAA